MAFLQSTHPNRLNTPLKHQQDYFQPNNSLSSELIFVSVKVNLVHPYIQNPASETEACFLAPNPRPHTRI